MESVARATTRDVWGGVVVRNDVARGVEFDARAVADRVATDFMLFVVARGVSTDVRAAGRFDCTELDKRWVFLSEPLFARTAAPPSRTAAPAPCANIRHDMIKIRIFFISD